MRSNSYEISFERINTRRREICESRESEYLNVLIQPSEGGFLLDFMLIVCDINRYDRTDKFRNIMLHVRSIKVFVALYHLAEECELILFSARYLMFYRVTRVRRSLIGCSVTLSLLLRFKSIRMAIVL